MQKQQEDIKQVDNKCKDGEKNMTVHCSHQQTNPGVPIASKPAYGKGNRAFEQEISEPQA